MPLSKQQKQETVKEIEKDLKEFPVIAIASLQNLPSRQCNLIRKKLRSQAKIDTARTTLMKKALENTRPEAKELEKYFTASSALLLTKMDAFRLFKKIKENKSKAFAKAGDIAPTDIIIPAGETSLTPGPVLTELKQAKIQAKIEGQKIVISKDCLVAKKGEAISEPVAKILAKLGIEPMEICLKINAVFQEGVIYSSEVLNVDEKQYLQQIIEAIQQAINLGVNAGVYNAVTTPLIIAKAVREANALNSVIKPRHETQQT